MCSAVLLCRVLCSSLARCKTNAVVSLLNECSCVLLCRVICSCLARCETNAEVRLLNECSCVRLFCCVGCFALI